MAERGNWVKFYLALSNFLSDQCDAGLVINANLLLFHSLFISYYVVFYFINTLSFNTVDFNNTNIVNHFLLVIKPSHSKTALKLVAPACHIYFLQSSYIKGNLWNLQFRIRMKVSLYVMHSSWSQIFAMLTSKKLLVFKYVWALFHTLHSWQKN